MEILVWVINFFSFINMGDTFAILLIKNISDTLNNIKKVSLILLYQYYDIYNPDHSNY